MVSGLICAGGVGIIRSADSAVARQAMT